jgi:glycosyltransferase involved in cell wall biosynthesis
MKVLHLFNEINYSGAELMYANAAPIFQANRIEMLAISTGINLGNFAEVFEQKNIKTYHWPIHSQANSLFKKIKYYSNFYKFIKEQKIDVLHIHRSNLYIAAFCSRLAGIRTIKTIHNVFKNRKLTYPYGYIQRLIARKLLNVTFQTIGQSVYENELNYYHNPSVRINNWFDQNRFYSIKNENEKQELRQKLNIKSDAFVIISVGGCSEIKNHSDILRAMAQLQKKSNFLYIHLGTGKIEEDEKNLALELGIQNMIQFLGNQNTVRDFLIASDVYVMTSKFEGLSIAGIEAMACGLPSILYNSPGLRDLIDKDDNGFLIAPDYQILATKIIEFQKNPELIRKKGQSAVEFVNRNFSMESNVLKIIKLYSNTIQSF